MAIFNKPVGEQITLLLETIALCPCFFESLDLDIGKSLALQLGNSDNT
jgi:hypothetical protein